MLPSPNLLFNKQASQQSGSQSGNRQLPPPQQQQKWQQRPFMPSMNMRPPQFQQLPQQWDPSMRYQRPPMPPMRHPYLPPHGYNQPPPPGPWQPPMQQHHMPPWQHHNTPPAFNSQSFEKRPPSHDNYRPPIISASNEEPQTDEPADLEGWQPPLIKLETPEDIAKWREQRKKNYPRIRSAAEPPQVEELKTTPLQEQNATIDNKSNEAKSEKQKGGGRHKEEATRTAMASSSGRPPWKSGQKRKFEPKHNNGQQRSGGRNNASKRKPTLFEKLMLNDVRREENKLLTCISLLVASDYKL